MKANLLAALLFAAPAAAADEHAPVFPSTKPMSGIDASAKDFAVPADASRLTPGRKRPRQIQLPVVRGVHMSGWGAGSPRQRREFIARIKASGLNAVVIALKEYDGYLFTKNHPPALKLGTFANAIPDLAGCVREFKEAGIYTIGRVVLFKDDLLARKRPELAVKMPDGRIWTNFKGTAWVDPYNREVWEYNLLVADRAAEAGFDEIQFDYVRFPSDGPISQARYSRADHTKETAARNIVEFLETASKRLRPKGVKLSIAVFGLTTTDDTGMGIGQRIGKMTDQVDAVSPMMYPSHYAKGSYGIENPNTAPYKTIQMGLRDAERRLGKNFGRLRPYFQDFSLGHRYGPAEIKAQIFAAARLGVTNWILWNAQNRYTWPGIPKPEEIELAALSGDAGRTTGPPPEEKP